LDRNVHTDKCRAAKEYSVDAVKLINMALLRTLLSAGDTSRQAEIGGGNHAISKQI
jgi:hypothetical protein